MADESWPGVAIDFDKPEPPPLPPATNNFADVFAAAEKQYGLQSGLLSAIAKQENVNPKHNNPLGLSTDKGVMSFSPSEAQDRIFKQAALLANPNGPYRDFVKSGSIEDLAKVYSPVGASNDLRGTNATEAAGIRANLPTGKAVNVEPVTDVSPEVKPIVTLPTRRAKAVNPADEPWPGVQIKAPEPEVPTMEKQVVVPHDDVADQQANLEKILQLNDLTLDPTNAAHQPMIAAEQMPPYWLAQAAKAVLPDSTATKIYTGELKGVADMMSSFTSPENLSLMGAMGLLKVPARMIGTAFSAYAAGKLPEEWKAFQAATDPEEKTRIFMNTVAGIGVPLLPFLGGRERVAPATAGAALPSGMGTPALPPAIDELIARRVQKPWDNAALSDDGGFIDVPFVRMDSGSIGDRVSAFMTPAEGQRPAQGIKLHPGEAVPPPLLGYPKVQHSDGSQTIFHPPQSEDEWQQVIQSEPEDVMLPETFDAPTQEELLQPTMTGKEFDNYLGELQRQDQVDQAREAMAMGGTPVMDFIKDVGGLISKSKAKKSGLYERAGGALWDDVPKELTGVDMRHLWNGTESPDNMATSLYNEGLIPQPDVGAMWDALNQEKNTLAGLSAAVPEPVKPPPPSNLPSVWQVRADLESLGITDAERKILAGKHYVVADTVTGQIRDLFGTKQEALDYLQQNGQAGEAAFQRDTTGDRKIGGLPDTAEIVRNREIQKATNALGKVPQSGADWDQYLNLEAPETDAQRVAREAAEAKSNEQIQAEKQKAKDIRIETKLGFKARKLTGDTGDLGQADMLTGGDLFSQAKPSTELAFRTPAELQAESERILALPHPSDVLDELKRLGYSKRAQKVWDAARNRAPDSERDFGADFYDAANDDLSDWEKAMRAKMERQRRKGGAIPIPQAIQDLAKAIKRGIAKSKLKDLLLGREGAVRNFADVYSRERSNVIRYDFGTLADANKKGTNAYKDLEALSAIEEAGYDPVKLNAHRNLVASAKPKLRDKWLPVYDRALRDFQRLTTRPNHLRSELDRQAALEKHNGVKLGHWQNYIPHMFDEAKKGFMFGLFGGQAGGGGLPRWFTKTRQYNSLAEAIHNGENPVSMNAADLAQARIRAGQRLVLYKAYHEMLKQQQMPDGTPVAVDSPQRGYQTITVQGIPLYVHPEISGYVKTLFDPSVVRQSATGRGALTVAGVQKAGQLGLDTFHAARLSLYNAGANKGMGRLPNVGLRRGLAVLELAPDSFRQAINSGEFSPEEVKWARQNRPLMQELLAQGAEVSKWGDNISGNLHRTIPGTRGLNTFIFDRLGRGALMSSMIENYKRNLSMYPRLSREQVARKTVIEMDEMFGNLGSKSVFKSKTFQDLSQFLFFARNWVESQAKNEARAYGQIAKYPYNVLEGLATGMGGKSFTRLDPIARSRLSLAMGLLVAGQILNMALNGGKSTFENEEGKKLQVKIPKGTLGLKNTYYFDTAQIPFEFSHQIAKYLRHGEGVIGSVVHVAQNKLSKLARGTIGAFTGQTYKGGPVTQPGMDRFRQVLGEELPVPIAAGGALEQEPRSNFLFRVTRRPDAMMLQGAASLGAKLEPQETATQQMWRKLDASGFRKPDDNTGPGKYSQLKHALQNRDIDSVTNEVQMLLRETNDLKAKRHQFDEIRGALGIRLPSSVERDPSKPLIAPQRFTGSVVNESKFQRSLSPQDKTLYREAQAEHEATARYYLILERRLKNQLLH